MMDTDSKVALMKAMVENFGKSEGVNKDFLKDAFTTMITMDTMAHKDSFKAKASNINIGPTPANPYGPFNRPTPDEVRAGSYTPLKSTTTPSASSWAIVDDDTEPNSKLSLDKVRELALEYGYSLKKIEYEGTEISGTNKINIKD